MHKLCFVYLLAKAQLSTDCNELVNVQAGNSYVIQSPGYPAWYANDIWQVLNQILVWNGILIFFAFAYPNSGTLLIVFIHCKNCCF